MYCALVALLLSLKYSGQKKVTLLYVLYPLFSLCFSFFLLLFIFLICVFFHLSIFFLVCLAL